MNQEKLSCPKCNGEMVQGYVSDCADIVVLQSQWVEGKPEKNWIGALKVSNHHPIPLGTFRCRSCGVLESYARAEFEAK